MPITHIAFLQDMHSLNGAVRVSIDTAKYLSERFGIKTTFINPNGKPTESNVSIPFVENMNEIFLAGYKKRNIQENTTLLNELITHEGIQMIFTPYPAKIIPIDFQMIQSCKVVIWHHEHPYSKIIRKRRLLHGLSNDPLRRRIDYFITQWPRYYLFRKLTKRRTQNDLKKKIKQADYLITLTEGYRDLLIKDLGLSTQEQEKIVVLRNTLKIEPKPNLKKEKLAVFMGRIMRDTKQVDLLFDIWQECAKALPDWKFEFYGKGSYTKALTKKITDYRLANIEYKGYCPDPDSVFRRAAFSCVTSSTEGYCLAITEAQNQGCIPIAFNAPGAFHEVIGTKDPAGILISPYDKETYISSFITFAKDEHLRAQMQKRILTHRHFYDKINNDAKWIKLLELQNTPYSSNK